MTLSAFNALNSTIDHHTTSTFDSLNMGMGMDMEYAPNAQDRVCLRMGSLGFADVRVVGGGVAEY